MNNTFGINIIPPNDEQRVNVLKSYRLLDTPTERVFDNMTKLAANMFNVPISLISLVDAEMVFFKSSVGVGSIKCADRGESLCALAILSPDVMIFEDARKELVAADSAPVKAGVRFYAGAPLKTKDGFLIGTICIVDFQPRSFGNHDKQVLENIATIVMEQMELRLTALTEIEKQAKLMEKKDEFISVASHELKTPITILMASMQMLDKIKNDPKAEVLSRLITQSNKSLKKLKHLIDELLNMSLISSGQLQINKSRFKINELIGACCEDMGIDQTNRVKWQGDKASYVDADAQKIDQVVCNLLTNAVKYSPKLSVITVSVGRSNDFVRVSVRDDGPGIPPSQLGHIFERYYRGDKRNVNFSGLGLGLYISSEIVKAHGGEMGVISELGKGSTFWFTLSAID